MIFKFGQHKRAVDYLASLPVLVYCIKFMVDNPFSDVYRIYFIIRIHRPFSVNKISIP